VFKIDNLFVDDKKLHLVLRALTGLAIAPGPVPVPVVNAKKGRNGLEAVTNGELVTLLVAWIKKQKLTTVTASDIKNFCGSIGKAPSAYAYALKKAVEYKVLRKTGKGTKSKYVLTGQGVAK
jgi:hypothetical protein